MGGKWQTGFIRENYQLLIDINNLGCVCRRVMVFGASSMWSRVATRAKASGIPADGSTSSTAPSIPKGAHPLRKKSHGYTCDWKPWVAKRPTPYGRHHRFPLEIYNTKEGSRYTHHVSVRILCREHNTIGENQSFKFSPIGLRVKAVFRVINKTAFAFKDFIVNF